MKKRLLLVLLAISFKMNYMNASDDATHFTPRNDGPIRYRDLITLKDNKGLNVWTHSNNPWLKKNDVYSLHYGSVEPRNNDAEAYSFDIMIAEKGGNNSGRAQSGPEILMLYKKDAPNSDEVIRYGDIVQIKSMATANGLVEISSSGFTWFVNTRPDTQYNKAPHILVSERGTQPFGFAGLNYFIIEGGTPGQEVRDGNAIYIKSRNGGDYCVAVPHPRGEWARAGHRTILLGQGTRKTAFQIALAQPTGDNTKSGVWQTANMFSRNGIIGNGAKWVLMRDGYLIEDTGSNAYATNKDQNQRNNPAFQFNVHLNEYGLSFESVTRPGNFLTASGDIKFHHWTDGAFNAREHKSPDNGPVDLKNVTDDHAHWIVLFLNRDPQKMVIRNLWNGFFISRQPDGKVDVYHDGNVNIIKFIQITKGESLLDQNTKQAAQKVQQAAQADQQKLQDKCKEIANIGTFALQAHDGTYVQATPSNKISIVGTEADSQTSSALFIAIANDDTTITIKTVSGTPVSAIPVTDSDGTLLVANPQAPDLAKWHIEGTPNDLYLVNKSTNGYFSKEGRRATTGWIGNAMKKGDWAKFKVVPVSAYSKMLALALAQPSIDAKIDALLSLLDAQATDRDRTNLVKSIETLADQRKPGDADQLSTILNAIIAKKEFQHDHAYAREVLNEMNVAATNNLAINNKKSKVAWLGDDKYYFKIPGSGYISCNVTANNSTIFVFNKDTTCTQADQADYCIEIGGFDNNRTDIKRRGVIKKSFIRSLEATAKADPKTLVSPEINANALLPATAATQPTPCWVSIDNGTISLGFANQPAQQPAFTWRDQEPIREVSVVGLSCSANNVKFEAIAIGDIFPVRLQQATVGTLSEQIANLQALAYSLNDSPATTPAMTTAVVTALETFMPQRWSLSVTDKQAVLTLYNRINLLPVFIDPTRGNLGQRLSTLISTFSQDMSITDILTQLSPTATAAMLAVPAGVSYDPTKKQFSDTTYETRRKQFFTSITTLVTLHKGDSSVLIPALTQLKEQPGLTRDEETIIANALTTLTPPPATSSQQPTAPVTSTTQVVTTPGTESKPLVTSSSAPTQGAPITSTTQTITQTMPASTTASTSTATTPASTTVSTPTAITQTTATITPSTTPAVVSTPPTKQEQEPSTAQNAPTSFDSYRGRGGYATHRGVPISPAGGGYAGRIGSAVRGGYGSRPGTPRTIPVQ